MSEKSFYDLDYIIEINEQRLEEYTTAYQKVLERLTHVILIYSAITIFLIPIIQDSSLFRISNPIFLLFLIIFLGLLVVSLVFTIRLIIPGDLAYLNFPKKYYRDYRKEYEKSIEDKESINELLKVSYVRELEEILANNEKALRIKSTFQYKALIFALISIVPYLVCLTFHLSQKSDNVQKVQIVNTENLSNFMKPDTMAKCKDDKKTTNVDAIKANDYPGVDNSLVLDSHPIYRRENSSVAYTFTFDGKKVYIK